MEEQMIFVDGGSRKQRELTYDIASFAWMKLMPRIRKCTVNFKLKKLKVYHGTCLDIGDREFDIEVEKRLSLGDDFITTIFHEMTHVKQLVYREFFTECNFYESREEYLNLPWEVEAYAKQEELLEQWNKHKKTS
jgi:hypothetical protein|tara:strand:+ start:1159 stop:1563 length:405 start_codon:yes stop_codon:yes gene_type:complete